EYNPDACKACEKTYDAYYNLCTSIARATTPDDCEKAFQSCTDHVMAICKVHGKGVGTAMCMLVRGAECKATRSECTAWARSFDSDCLNSAVAQWQSCEDQNGCHNK